MMLHWTLSIARLNSVPRPLQNWKPSGRALRKRVRPHPGSAGRVREAELRARARRAKGRRLHERDRARRGRSKEG